MKNVLLMVAALCPTSVLSEVNQTISVGSAISALEGKGYVVREVDVLGPHLEVEVTNRAGAPVELIVDARTAEIIWQGRDD